jgi:hypothetical protein
MEKYKVFIGILCLVAILLTSLYLYKNREFAFTHYAEIEYKNGDEKCIERYKNTVLITASCQYLIDKILEHKLSYGLNVSFINFTQT